MSVLKNICLVVIVFALFSCNKKNKEGRNPYCEFVDGVYTFDLDLRRTICYQGSDFDFKYFDDSMRHTDFSDAKLILIKGLGFYSDENIHSVNEIEINYSSLFLLPNINKIKTSYLNILTTLQAQRVMCLVKLGDSYDDAVIKSKKEIFSQICYSDYFCSIHFDRETEFTSMSASSNLLIVLSRALSYYISESVKLSEDRRSIACVWDDYVESYASTGDMALSSLEPQNEEARRFINTLSENLSLKVSVSRYKVPFSGGIPQVKGDNIYYGVDTTSYVNKYNMVESSSLQVNYPSSKHFTCNGYISLNADIYVDSLNINENIFIKVFNLNKFMIDSVYTYKKSSYDSKFSTLIWLKEEAKYKVDFMFGKDSVSYEADNKLTISIN